MSAPLDAPLQPVHPEVGAYIAALDPGADPLLHALEEAAEARGFPLIGRSSGRLMELLCRAIGARRVLELGSGFGYSAYFFARAVGEGGEVVCTEKDTWELEHHRRLYADSPLAVRIRYRLGNALEHILQEPGPFDAALLDLDKQSYLAALEPLAERLRPGGLLFVDNTLWGGRVCRGPRDPSTEAVHRFNRVLASDARFESALLPVGDGLTVARRR